MTLGFAAANLIGRFLGEIRLNDVEKTMRLVELLHSIYRFGHDDVYF